MKKILLLVLVCVGTWNYYTKNIEDNKKTFDVEYSKEKKDSFEPDWFSENKLTFSCDGRTHCSQMSSYEEAKFFINNCPNTKMDGDHDGEPCESQFRGH